jgi:hypothetical protein
VLVYGEGRERERGKYQQFGLCEWRRIGWWIVGLELPFWKVVLLISDDWGWVLMN